MNEIDVKSAGQNLKNLAFEMRVLYVEDDLVIQEQFKKFLLRFFAHVDTANNGVEALEVFEKGKYELIVTDLSMPQMGGMEFAKIIKERDDEQYIIVISAHSESHKLINLINIGVDGFILKPIEVDLVVRQLGKICKEIANRNMSEYYNKLLEDTNKELQRSNDEYQIAMAELSEYRRKQREEQALKKAQAEEKKESCKVMSADEYNYIYATELSSTNENLEELEFLFNQLLLDKNYDTKNETIMVLRHIFKTYAYEIEMIPLFSLLATSMRRLEKRLYLLENTGIIPSMMQMCISLFSEMERWRLGVLKHKYFEDIHQIDNELICEILTLEKYLGEHKV